MKRPHRIKTEAGTSFCEVLMAMVVTMVALTSAMGAFSTAERIVSQGAQATRAMAMVKSRLEAKRSVRWEQLLVDDLDHDGNPDVTMRDDGFGGDHTAGDGVYSAMQEQDGIVLTWTVAPNRAGRLGESGLAVLEARASFRSADGAREVRLATMRANPAFSGSH